MSLPLFIRTTQGGLQFDAIKPMDMKVVVIDMLQFYNTTADVFRKAFVHYQTRSAHAFDGNGADALALFRKIAESNTKLTRICREHSPIVLLVLPADFALALSTGDRAQLKEAIDLVFIEPVRAKLGIPDYRDEGTGKHKTMPKLSHASIVSFIAIDELAQPVSQLPCPCSHFSFGGKMCTDVRSSFEYSECISGVAQSSAPLAARLFHRLVNLLGFNTRQVIHELFAHYPCDWLPRAPDRSTAIVSRNNIPIKCDHSHIDSKRIVVIASRKLLLTSSLSLSAFSLLTTQPNTANLCILARKSDREIMGCGLSLL